MLRRTRALRGQTHAALLTLMPGRAGNPFGKRQLPLILALGTTTQTLAWASSYYLPAILADPIAESGAGFFDRSGVKAPNEEPGCFIRLDESATIRAVPHIALMSCRDGMAEQLVECRHHAGIAKSLYQHEQAPATSGRTLQRKLLPAQRQDRGVGEIKQNVASAMVQVTRTQNPKGL
jgi:hypothetical protein